MANLASDILSGLSTVFRVPVEESHETYVSTKPPQEGQDTRFSQAHEHGRWAKDRRCSAAARAAAAGRLIVVAGQAHTPDRLSGV